MRAVWPALLLGACSMAGPGPLYVDNPAYCDQPTAEQELADLATLLPTGIESHGQSCRWDRPLAYGPGLVTTVTATCDDGARQWQTPIELMVNDDGSVTAPAPGLPHRFFPCT